MKLGTILVLKLGIWELTFAKSTPNSSFDCQKVPLFYLFFEKKSFLNRIRGLIKSFLNQTTYVQGEPKGSEQFLKSGCGSQMSQATPTKFFMLFKHNYGKLF